MTSTALGAPRAWADRIVPLRARFAPSGWLGPEDIEIMNEAVHEQSEMPWVGSVSSVGDLFRLAEMVRDYLGEAGFRVARAASGNSGLAMHAREVFDAIVLDPPKLIFGRTEQEEGRKKYLDLNRLAAGLVRPGGLLVTCSCSGALPRDEFIHMTTSAARHAQRQAQILDVTGAGPVVYGLFADRGEAERAAAALSGRGVTWLATPA